MSLYPPGGNHPFFRNYAPVSTPSSYCIGYSVIIKLPCALLQTGHLETVHAPVADTVAYFADLDAPVVDTVTYFGGNHRSRV